MSALRGKRIVVTRATDQAEGLGRALEVAGAHVILCPTIEVAPPVSYADLDAALARLADYRWLALTSSPGVRAVMSRMAHLGLGPGSLDPQKVAAVGSSTARTLEELRRGVDGITFTSPSALRGFLRVGEEWRELLAGVRVVSLGPATTELARREGVRVDVEAEERSMSGLVDALVGAFAASAGGSDEESAT